MGHIEKGRIQYKQEHIYICNQSPPPEKKKKEKIQQLVTITVYLCVTITVYL